MTNLFINMFVVGAVVAGSQNVMAQSLSDADYKTRKIVISHEYKNALKRCDYLAGNTKDVCRAEAKARQDKARAELEAAREPSAKNHYKSDLTAAEADYAVAKEQCKSKTANEKDVCLKEAEATEVKLKADAKVKFEAATSSPGNTAETREEAAEYKREASYEADKEKCDVLAGNAKDRCITQIKRRYGE
ncbi:MAG TPA: hypothetical protein VFF74_06775 [Methylophilaceae bacterium]|nr:hypothetical protein [Methylophilaceae bacterium]